MTVLSQVADTVLGVATDAAAVTPNDSTVVAFRALYVGTTGDVSLVTLAGAIVTFASVPAGAILPIACTKVRSTGTTASNIVGLV
jgi:hypothetical protein